MKASLATLLLLTATPVSAERPPCGPVVDMRAWLIEEYGESIAFVGQISDQMTAELWLAGPSWTVMTVSASGHACLILSGEVWQAIPSPTPGTPG